MRELSSRGASRRRMPTLARIRESGAYQPYIEARSSVETISSVSSSWLRRNVLHWPPRGDRGGVGHDVDDGRGLLVADRVEDPRHHREVEAHVALGLVLGAEVVHDLLGPLVRLGQHDPTRVLVVQHAADLAQERVRLRQVLAVRALGLEQVRHRVEPEAVDPEVEPEPADVEHRVDDPRVVEVQVGLVAEEPVPEVLAAHGVERPVRRLGVDEDDAGVLVAGVLVRPDVEVAVRPLGVRPRRLEPGVLVAGVVHDEVDDQPHAARVRLLR